MSQDRPTNQQTTKPIQNTYKHHPLVPNSTNPSKCADPEAEYFKPDTRQQQGFPKPSLIPAETELVEDSAVWDHD